MSLLQKGTESWKLSVCWVSNTQAGRTAISVRPTQLLNQNGITNPPKTYCDCIGRYVIVSVPDFLNISVQAGRKRGVLTQG